MYNHGDRPCLDVGDKAESEWRDLGGKRSQAGTVSSLSAEP